MTPALPPLPWPGGCACDAVRYTVTGEPVAMYACHCRDCQRQSGSAYGLVVRVAAAHFAVDWALLASFERRADSGAMMTCHFCPECGARIVHTRADRDAVNVRAGTLDDTSFVRPTAHLWTSRALPGVAIDPGAYAHPRQPDDPNAVIDAFRATIPA